MNTVSLFRNLPAIGLLVLLSVIYCTSCDRQEKDLSPNDESATAEDRKRSEDELLQAQREEEQAQLEEARRKEEQAQLEEARRKEEQAQIDETRRKEEVQAQREEVRLQAKGQKIDRLETLKGKVYEGVTINQVSPVGLSILHEAGTARIPFEDLPMDLQKRFMFDRDEKEDALALERTHQNAHDAFISSSPAENPSGKNITDPERKKVMMALASKEARVRSLEAEIPRIRNDIQSEENKKVRRDGYYYDSNGYRKYYGSRSIGGISRAPILRQELAEKERELAILQRQIAMLRVELESVSP
jgi:hypothetical protein